VLKKTLFLVAGSLIGASIGVAGISFATSQATSTGVFYGCLWNSNPVRQNSLIDVNTIGPLSHCPPGYEGVSWNSQGPAGPAGPAGPQGGDATTTTTSVPRTYYLTFSQVSSSQSWCSALWQSNTAIGPDPQSAISGYSATTNQFDCSQVRAWESATFPSAISYYAATSSAWGDLSCGSGLSPFDNEFLLRGNQLFNLGAYITGSPTYEVSPSNGDPGVSLTFISPQPGDRLLVVGTCSSTTSPSQDSVPTLSSTSAETLSYVGPPAPYTVLNP
jgi:hypothetical protein